MEEGYVVNNLILIFKIGYNVETKKQATGLFQCFCGEFKFHFINNVTSGKTKSCGCLARQKPKTLRLLNKEEYLAWKSMKQRCYNKNRKDYENYGGRGIDVCDRWLESFENFYEDLGNRPENTSLDRIDVNKGYYPDNCRWATRSMQTFNQRSIGNKTESCTGVYFDKNKKLWRAGITVNGKPIYLGRYKDLNDAIEARKLAEIKYYGENRGK